MKHKIHHGLSKDLAQTAAHKAFESYKERFAQYNPTATWHDEDHAEVGFTAKGITLNGEVEITDHEIILDLDVPFILKPFKKKAVGVIEGEIQKWVDKAQKGELE